VDQQIKEIWATALESGEFEQGFNQLASERIVTDDTTRAGKLDSDDNWVTTATYCCLGVLSELAVRAGAITGFDHIQFYPTVDVMNWAGFTESEYEIVDDRDTAVSGYRPKCELNVDGIADSVSAEMREQIEVITKRAGFDGELDVLNDGRVSFAAIAQIIRKHF
jgi:hypothetical protein